MDNNDLTALLKSKFPQFSDELIEALQSKGEFNKIEKNYFILMEGETCGNVPLIIDGTLKIIKEEESGKEFVLYRVNPGESCIMSITSNILQTPAQASVISETEVHVLMIPLSDSNDLTSIYPEWNRFIFQSVNDRYFGMIEKAASITFKSLGERLYDALQNISVNNEIETTHENLAQELGTAREVISRLLKNMEKKGLLTIRRGKITLL